MATIEDIYKMAGELMEKNRENAQLIKEICDLEKKVGTLENTVEELRETVEMYADNQRNNKRGF